MSTRFPRFGWMFLALAFLAPSAVAGGSGCGGSHPHFDDRGTLTWYPTLAAASEAARAQGKIIFMESGRRRCGQCRVLCTQVLPHCSVRARLSKIAVGLASNCDAMEPAVDALVRRHLANANCLPFVAFLRADGSWITGFSGGRSVDQFLGDLAIAERACTASAPAPAPTPVAAPTPAPAPAPATLERVAAAATPPAAPARTAANAPKPCHVRAENAARRGEWGEVVRLWREADGSDAVMARMRVRAREWAHSRLAQAVTAASQTHFDEAQAAANEVHTAMGTESEGLDAEMGLQAVRLAREIAALVPDSPEREEARKKALEKMGGTRWEQLFA